MITMTLKSEITKNQKTKNRKKNFIFFLLFIKNKNITQKETNQKTVRHTQTTRTNLTEGMRLLTRSGLPEATCDNKHINEKCRVRTRQHPPRLLRVHTSRQTLWAENGKTYKKQTNQAPSGPASQKQTK